MISNPPRARVLRSYDFALDNLSLLSSSIMHDFYTFFFRFLQLFSKVDGASFEARRLI
jgi:hypothetical protein